MTLLKDNNYKSINVALLSLEADIKNKTFDTTSAIEKQLEEINERIDEINAGSNSNSGNSGSSDDVDNSAEINDLRAEIENINSEIDAINGGIDDIEQKLSNIFSAENFVEDFNTATEPGVYYWTTNAANRPNNYGVLLVNRYHEGSDWINQVAYSTSDKIYFRQKVNNNEWRDWQTIAYEDITKTYTIPDVTTVTGRYIKLGTFPWWFAETVKVYLSGNNFEDTVEFNVLGGEGSAASVNGWYTTNSGKTTGIYVVPVAPVSYTSNIEVWLRVEQYTTLTVKLIGNAIAAQYFNTNAQMNNTTAFPTGAKLAAYFNMKRGYFGYNENTLNCYDTAMTDIGFTQNQVVSVSEFAQALINYTGIHRGQVHFAWADATRAYIKATTPYNTQLEINGGTVIFHSRSHNVSAAWNTFDAQYINRAGELYTFGIQKDSSNVVEYVRKAASLTNGGLQVDGMTTAGNLAIKNNTDVTLSSFGQEPLSIGTVSGDNLGIDINEIQARHNGTVAPLYLNGNGGKVVINDTKNSSGGLQVDGNTTLLGNSNVGLSSYGKDPLSIGPSSGANIGIDGDDIQARNNGVASSLDLNYYGGLVRVNAASLTNGGLLVGGRLNIPTSAPSNPTKGDIWLVL